jgi:FtsZ-interacting cell division protein ZipA
MTSLQLGLIIGGVVLVVGVIVYNWMQERRMRRRLAGPASESAADTTRTVRIEPKLARGGRSDEEPPPRRNYAAASGPAVAHAEADETADEFVAPVQVIQSQVTDLEGDDTLEPGSIAAGVSTSRLKTGGPDRTNEPDPDAECVVVLVPDEPVTAAAIATGLHAGVGKPLRWLARSSAATSWQLLRPDMPGEWSEIAACLLLADRTGPVTPPMMERFLHLLGDIAASVHASYTPPNGQAEVDRAEALDRLCGDLDVQVGLTLLKPSPGTIAGTRLRGVAEAAGFRLTDHGRFEWIQEETGCILFSLQNYKAEPFTAESLRLTSTPGAVFILDVPRVSDPVRVFDQMKMSAKRMTHSLDATLVDDNRRPLDDAALAAIREQVQATAQALKEIHVAPGSRRALALFGG